MNVQLTFTPSLEEYGQGLQEKSGLLDRVIEERVSIIAHGMQKFIQAELSGPVLQTRTGVLLRSVEATTTPVWTGDIVSSVVGIDDGQPSFKYGIVHEMGGKGWYDIFPKNKLALAFDVSADMPWGGIFTTGKDAKAIKRANSTVVAHVHHPPAEKRPYIAPAVAEFEQIFYDDLKTALANVLGGTVE